MGCAPSHKVGLSFESKETMNSPRNKYKEKDKIFLPPRSRVIKSRFLNKMLKFKSDLNVIYESPGDMEASILIV